MAKWCLVLLASGFCIVGCAKNYVLSDDRVALWSAGMTAVSENDYDIVRADEVKGVLAGTKSLMTDEEVTRKERLQLAIDRGDSAYRATVTVRRSGPPIAYAATDIAVRRERGRMGGTGRVANEYGTVARRDFDEEKAVLSRMRALLNPAAAAAAPPPASP